jgi:transcriptional regulator with XRE-family HTH domain
MPTPDKQLSAEQSRQIAEVIREEIARRRISRQTLAEQAKLSLSTLEKVLGGRRPFTLATTVRLEQALGVSLRKAGTRRRRLARPRTAISRRMASGPIRAVR